MQRTVVLFVATLLQGCASVSVERGDWCIRKGGIHWSIPIDPLPHKAECKSRQILNRIFK